jgi:hypothetical protein
MSDSSQNRDGAAGRSDNAAERLRLLAASLLDIWSLGATTFESVLAQSAVDRRGEPLAPYFDTYARAATTIRGLAEAGVGALAGQSSESSDASGKAADMASLTAEAYLLAITSCFRYWRGLAQVYGSHQSEFLRSLAANISDPTCLMNIDLRQLKKFVPT